MCKAGLPAAWLIVSLGALSASFPVRLFHKTIRVYSEPEAYRVYAAILPENLAYKRSTATVIIREETRSNLERCFSPHLLHDALVGSAIAEYRRLSRSPWKLARFFPISKPYELAPETDFAGFWWKPSSPLGEYIRSHPEFPGIIELSAVGFNREKTIAVVYMGYKREVLSSGWYVQILRKQNGHWRQIIGQGLGCLGKS